MAALQGTKRVWRDESEFKHLADAELVQDEIDLLAAQDPNGKCKNQALVDFARQNPSSESHKCFDWNNVSAAEKYRLHQAARIKNGIRTLMVPSATVKIERAEPQVIEVVTNHALPTPGEGHKNIEVILQSQADTLALEREMHNSLRQYAASFKTRFALAPNASTYIQMLDNIVSQSQLP